MLRSNTEVPERHARHYPVFNLGVPLCPLSPPCFLVWKLFPPFKKEHGHQSRSPTSRSWPLPSQAQPALQKVTDLSWSSWETCCADACMSHVGTWSIFIEQTPTYSWIYFSKFSKADFSRVPNPHFLPSHPNSVMSIVFSQKPVSKQGLASRSSVISPL